MLVLQLVYNIVIVLIYVRLMLQLLYVLAVAPLLLVPLPLQDLLLNSHSLRLLLRQHLPHLLFADVAATPARLVRDLGIGGATCEQGVLTVATLQLVAFLVGDAALAGDLGRGAGASSFFLDLDLLALESRVRQVHEVFLVEEDFVVLVCDFNSIEIVVTFSVYGTLNEAFVYSREYL